jgi:PTS system mannose-specific IIB component
MKTHKHLRVDNRLLHGQVVQFWIPHLGIQRLIIADDGVANDPSLQIIYRMALPEVVELTLIPVNCLMSELEKQSVQETLVLVKDIASAKSILKNCDQLRCITLGNIHSSPERDRVTDSIYLSKDEYNSLVELKRLGFLIKIETFPGDVLRLEVNNGGDTKWVKS